VKKLIETALPLSTINSKTFSERTAATGHPANLHLWWGRSPIYSCVASLAAAMIDAPEDRGELLSRLGRVLSGMYADSSNKPTVFDPFSGFGGIPLAAQQLGLSSVASDLNPVAVLLTKAATEIPYKFANQPPVNQYSLFKDYTGAVGLAEDVQFYGEWLMDRAKEKLKDIYPNEADGIPAAWIWVRTAKCPNPACGCRMPLSSSYIINGKSGHETWAEPIVTNGAIHFELRSGKCPKEKETNKFRNYGARFICPVCGEITTDEYIKQQGLSHELGSQLMAMVIDTPNGRVYKNPTEQQELAANVPIPDNIPQGEIPDNAHWFSPPGFGLKDYADLFSPRQLLMLTTFCDLLLEVQDKVASDALAAGMAPTGGSLTSGGTGALAYGQAISVYLAFIIDKIADRNTTVCSWNTSGGNQRATFGRQAIPMVWNYAEGNPFSTITGNFLTSLKNVVSAIEKLPCGAEVSVCQADAVTGVYPDDVLVCTELPYYKAIGYAHLSDFFYIWLRRSLKPIFPELFNQMVTSKNELSTVGQYYGLDQKSCERDYEENMLKVLRKLYSCSNSNYPTLLFFEFHKADHHAIYATDPSDNLTAWETMIGNIVHAGFAVNAVWPMRSEPLSDKADGYRVLIVAKKQDKNEQITRRGFINTLKRELPAQVEIALCAGVDSADKEMCALGCGLAIFTRYKKVMNADGTDMNVHDAMQIIGQHVAEILSIDADDSNNNDVTKED